MTARDEIKNLKPNIELEVIHPETWGLPKLKSEIIKALDIAPRTMDELARSFNRSTMDIHTCIIDLEEEKLTSHEFFTVTNEKYIWSSYHRFEISKNWVEKWKR